MTTLAASTCARMFAPSVVRFPAERQGCVQMFLAVSLVMAALYFSSAPSSFSLADFPPAGPVSQDSSSIGAFLNAWSACFLWHLITEPIAFAKALAMVSAHFSVAATFAAPGLSLLPGTHPVSSDAQDVVPPLLQSKCLPGPGGSAATALQAARRTQAKLATRRRFMGFLRCVSLEAAGQEEPAREAGMVAAYSPRLDAVNM